MSSDAGKGHRVPPRRKTSDLTTTAVQLKLEQAAADERRKAKGDAAGDDAEDLQKTYVTNAHLLSMDELSTTYKTDLDKGLTTDGYETLLAVHGPNKLSPRAVTPWWVRLIKSVFLGFFNILLWLGSVLSFVIFGIDSEEKGNLYIGIVLAFVVTVTGVFSYLQESKSEAIMEGFKNFLPQSVDVYRNGRVLTVLAESLVPGDVVQLISGLKLPADVRIFDCSKDCQVDNASITGESEPIDITVKKTNDMPMETHNLAFFGTNIVRGRAKGVVINTGDHTLMGRIARLADSTATAITPIAMEIDAFVLKISGLACAIGLTFFIIGMVQTGDIERNIIFIIGIIIANVPEGLLATVTVSLTLTAQRMATKNVLVKNLEAVETLGSTSVICSDKTGTLTTNIMTVSHVFYDLNECECDTQFPAEGEFDGDAPSFKALARCAALCNNAQVLETGEVSGDASETALVKFCNPQYDDRIAEFRRAHAQVHGIPFNSANKWQISVHERPDTDSYIIVLKGAPEKVLSYCTSYMTKGRVEEMNAAVVDRVREGVLSLGKKGERVLGFCQLELSSADFPKGFEFEGESRDNVNFPFGRANESGLTFLGLISMIDPPRPGVPQAVAKCQSAGIKVIMVTGDHPVTAKAIANKVGIISRPTIEDVAEARGIPVEEVNDDEAEAIVVSGMELQENLDQHETHVVQFWNRVLTKKNVVFARTSPQQKLQIVAACQERGGVVAVTGDGVNDSPALKKANIGVAMGITGTDVAKDAADMVLLDDNFASIVNGVEEGRIIFDNLKKSIAYTLSSNIPEILPFLLFTVVAIPLPLTTVMILLVDLGTDMAPAISFAHEGKEADIMRRPPRDPETDNLVTWRLVSFSYLQIGVIQALAGLYTYMVVLHDWGFHPEHLFGLESDQYFVTTDNQEEIDQKWLFCYQDTSVDCTYGNDGAYDTMVPAPGMDNRLMYAGELLDDSFPIAISDRVYALKQANTAYFISIIVVQWADLLICKTRSLSIYDQGMGNTFMNKSLLFETFLGFVICYIPALNTVFATADLRFVYWLAGMPFSIVIFSYDELRKGYIRKHRGGWLERVTYW